METVSNTVKAIVFYSIKENSDDIIEWDFKLYLTNNSYDYEEGPSWP